MLNIGDIVGGIFKEVINNTTRWHLLEDRIIKVTEGKKGVKYYTKKHFRPLDAKDIEFNTKLFEQANGCIFVDEVFSLTEDNRVKAERWIEWANKSNKEEIELF